MFTGIIQHCGRIAAVQSNPFGSTLIVDASGWVHHPEVGESIAVNGCCLTLAAPAQGGRLRFDIIQHTLGITALGQLAVGAKVNLEHAVTPQAMLGGHIVQGHIDGVGDVIAVHQSEVEHRVRIAPVDPALMDFVIEKGSIAVDGVSLTIAATHERWLEVALIPTTLELTNLGARREGDRVNLETDYIAKIIVNWLRRHRT